jgi:hypothetical protein
MTLFEVGTGNKIHFLLHNTSVEGQVKSTKHLCAFWDGKLSKCISWAYVHGHSFLLVAN